MSLHISATTGCNLGCTYCYENPDRERKQEWVDRQYDIDKIMEELEAWKELYPSEVPGMHGGEPLLVRDEHLEQIFSYIYDNWDRPSHIQTNATLMTEDHIEMFKKYNVNVGISCDGPKELNRLRKASKERDGPDHRATDNATLRTHEAIDKCLEAGVETGLIVVLNTQNAGTMEKFEKLLDWIDEKQEMGAGGHFNPAIPYEEVSPDEDVALSKEQLKKCYLRAWEWMKEEEYRNWGPMNYYVDNLLGNRLDNCVNNKCDVANAGAAKIIMGDGESTGCGKTWAQYGDGGTFLQGPANDSEYDSSEERYEVMKQTPGWVTEDMPDMGGCRGCRYWNVCQGGCPGAGEDDDYRSRTYFCKAKYALYEKVEQDLRALMPNIRLITDLPWDAEAADLASGWQLDIKPFVAMDPGEPGASSATRGANHDHGPVTDVLPDGENINTGDFEESVRKAKLRYDEDVLDIDRENQTWHADSAHVEQDDEEDDGGWSKVE